LKSNTKLSSRKEKIIAAVVDSYISSPEPVSSSDIKKQHLPDISSATIRNELASLEEMGYLAQPHTSAGRVPTAEAYRLYVEKLMPSRKLSKEELKVVEKYFNKKLTELDDILKSTAKVISEITNLTSVAYAQNMQNATIDSVKIVKLADTTALFVIVTSEGVIKDAMANINSNISEEFFISASNFISSVLRGYTINQAANPQKIFDQIRQEYELVFKAVLEILKNHSVDATSTDVILEGSAKILEQPEYANLQKAKSMLELFDAKEQLIPVLNQHDGMSLNIMISKDDEIKSGLPECAIVTANYALKGRALGKAGVIGPIRMDYSKVVSVLDYITHTLNFLPQTVQEVEEVKAKPTKINSKKGGKEKS